MYGSPLSLAPLILFITIFVGSGIYYSSLGHQHAFYQISPTVAIIPAIILAVLIGRDKIKNSLQYFLEGAGDINITTMVFIYLLAGGFVEVSKSIGGIDSTVNFALHFISDRMILPGIFLTSCAIAVAIGTSMGTIAAVTPIVIGIAESVGLPLPIAMGTLVGGAMFGDNLSSISDTTIAAVQTQGCLGGEKLKHNIAFAFPAVVLTILLLIMIGHTGLVEKYEDYELLKVSPYIVVFLLALARVNVLIGLTTGILLSGLIGFWTIPGYDVAFFSQKIFTGFTSNIEIIVLSIMIGGLGALIKRQGGLKYLIHLVVSITQKFTKNKDSRRVGEFSIFSLVTLTDVCTANNTVAILISGEAAREIAHRFGIESKRSATLIDIFACVLQGILPYSAQLLLVGSLAGISPFEIMPHIYYCYILGAIALLAIIFNYPQKVLSFKRRVVDS